MANNIEQFIDCVNEIFGVYLDSVNGFDSNLKFIEQAQQLIQQQTGLSLEYLDQGSLSYSNFQPSSDLKECAHLEKHRISKKEFKKNNASGGLNHRKALEYCLCDLFNRWDEFKRDVLKKSGAADKNIMPVMCYLKQVRDRLSHHKDDLKNGKKIHEHPLKYAQHTLPSFDVNQPVELSGDNLDAIIVELRSSLQTQNSDFNRI